MENLTGEQYKTLSQTKLFQSIRLEEIPDILYDIHAGYTAYQKEAFAVKEGECIKHFGILLSGKAKAVKQDREGRLLIITLLCEGDEIGVLLAASRGHASPVSVQLSEDASVLWIPFEGLLSGAGRHVQLLRNYISVVAEKGLILHERIDCLLKPTLKGKIFAYLEQISQGRKNIPFDIPLDRNAMAEYLNVDRSALSRELSRMKQEGRIDYFKNSFKLL